VANTLTAVTPKLLAQGLLALREHAIMPQLVNRRYEAKAAEKGSTIDVPIPSAITAVAVTAAEVPPSTADIAPTSVAIALDQWYEAPFYLTDKDVLEAMEGTIPMQASEAVKALANNVDNYILALYKKFYGYHSTEDTGVTRLVFTDSSGDPSNTADATQMRTILNRQIAPMTDRHVVLDPGSEGAALNIRAFQDASFGGGVQALLQGQLNQKLGFRWWMDQNIPTHTAGTITTGAIAKASTAQVVGDKTIIGTTAASTGAINWVAGDIIIFAGQTQTYVVTTAVAEASASTDFNFVIEPGLVVALAGSEAISIKASHSVNLAFHRDAIAFATRPLASHGSALGVISQSAIDPISGLALRLEVTHEHKRVRFSYDILYGAEVVRREFGARLGSVI
jgi:hypothetical protein